MPDWVAHIAAAYIICAVLAFRYRQFNTPNMVLVMVGAVLPDLVKVAMIGDVLGYSYWDLIWPMHLPVGSLLIAGMASLLFKERKTAFLFFILGVATHYILDLLLYNVSGGLALLFPFYWGTWQLDLFTTENYYFTLAVLLVALAVYLISYWSRNRNLNAIK